MSVVGYFGIVQKPKGVADAMIEAKQHNGKVS
jgi:hypothetical protein